MDVNGQAQWIYTRDTKEHKKYEITKLGRFVPENIPNYYTKIGKHRFTFKQLDESEDDYSRSTKTTIEMRDADSWYKVLRRNESVEEFLENIESKPNLRDQFTDEEWKEFLEK